MHENAKSLVTTSMRHLIHSVFSPKLSYLLVDSNQCYDFKLCKVSLIYPRQSFTLYSLHSEQRGATVSKNTVGPSHSTATHCTEHLTRYARALCILRPSSYLHFVTAFLRFTNCIFVDIRH